MEDSRGGLTGKAQVLAFCNPKVGPYDVCRVAIRVNGYRHHPRRLHTPRRWHRHIQVRLSHPHHQGLRRVAWPRERE